MFRHYETEFTSTTREIASNIERFTGMAAAEREALAKSTSTLIEGAADLLKQMDMEARSQPAAEAKASKSVVKMHQTSLAGLKTALKDARSGRTELLGGGCSDPDSHAERDRLILANEKMQKGTETLRSAVKVAAEAEMAGAATLQDLNDQRETIERTRGRLTKAGAGLDRTRRVLQTMGRRALANKLIMWAMIGILSLLILILLYIMMFGSGGGGSDDDETEATPPAPPSLEGQLVEESDRMDR